MYTPEAATWKRDGMTASLARAGLPTVFVFEGGYAVDAVGVNAVNVLQGFTSP